MEMMIDAKTLFGCFHCISISDATQRLVWKKGGPPFAVFPEDCDAFSMIGEIFPPLYAVTRGLSDIEKVH